MTESQRAQKRATDSHVVILDNVLKKIVEQVVRLVLVELIDALGEAGGRLRKGVVDQKRVQ